MIEFGLKPAAAAPDEPPAILRALQTIRERWWIVALAVVVCVGASVAYSATATKQYEATSKLLMRQSQLSSALGFGGDLFPTSIDPSRDTSTDILLVTSGTVADQVLRSLRLDESRDSLISQVTVTSEQNADVLAVTATDPEPARAARIANGFAVAYVGYRQEADRSKVRQGQALLRERIASLPPDATSDRTELQQALQKLTALEAVQTGDAEIVERASIPTSPSSPKPLRNAILALVLGIGLGIALALFLDVLDRRVKSLEDFERVYGLHALAGIPQRSFRQTFPAERSAEFEPFRILRDSIFFAGFEREIRTVLVTSSVPGEGKTSVATNLARAVALSGRSVILVEADLRRPTFAARFGFDRRVAGLTSALVGRIPIRDLLQAPGADAGSGIRVLPSGPVPPNPSEMLQSRRMGEVLQELGDEADLVILDGPPLLPVADARILLDRGDIDAAIVVARAFQTRRDEARRARTVLGQHRLAPLGLAVTGLPGGSSYEYYGAADVTDFEELQGPEDITVPRAEPIQRRKRVR